VLFFEMTAFFRQLGSRSSRKGLEYVKGFSGHASSLASVGTVPGFDKLLKSVPGLAFRHVCTAVGHHLHLGPSFPVTGLVALMFSTYHGLARNETRTFNPHALLRACPLTNFTLVLAASHAVSNLKPTEDRLVACSP